jgi:hypothetical protein
MADKNWNEMSVSEKCEYLATERRRMIDFVNELAAEIARLRGQVNGAASKLNEVAKTVEKLEARLDKMDGKKP